MQPEHAHQECAHEVEDRLPDMLQGDAPIQNLSTSKECSQHWATQRSCHSTHSQLQGEEDEEHGEDEEHAENGASKAFKG